MWVKCTKAYSTLFEKGEWCEIAAAGKTLFSILHPAGVQHFVWDTQHFDTTTARLKPPGIIPNPNPVPAPPKRKLEAGMWVKAISMPDNDNGRLSTIGLYYPVLSLSPDDVVVNVDGTPLTSPRENRAFDLDNPLTAEELAAAVATRIEPTVINSVEEAKHGYRGMPFLKIASTLREPYKPHTDNVLQQADKLIYGDRQKAYGSVSTNFANIAKGWSVILGTEVSAEQVGLCMAWLKIARQVNKPNIDNLIDAAGYVGCVEKVQKGL